MTTGDFWTNLASGILSILGIFAMVLGRCLYTILKNYLMQKLSLAESIGEAQARDLFTKFSKEAYNAVEQLSKQGLIETSKKDTFDKLFKDNFPNADQQLIDLYREAMVGKANAEKARERIESIENATVTINDAKPIPVDVVKG